MYTCIYIYIYIYTYVYLSIYLSLSLYIYIYIYLYLSLSIYIYIDIYIYIYMQPKTSPHPRIPAARLFFASQRLSVFSSTWGIPKWGVGITFWAPRQGEGHAGHRQDQGAPPPYMICNVTWGIPCGHEHSTP